MDEHEREIMKNIDSPKTGYDPHAPSRFPNYDVKPGDMDPMLKGILTLLIIVGLVVGILVFAPY
ncbi:hypothetical protein LCGC14_0765010 [marine sediment metagenome]|uniref:Uncharacterized protein n=1 Tax=marine sediment metagenome TaxID=412755 RepID=A0A0F9QJX0_9ZZZZ